MSLPLLSGVNPSASALPAAGPPAAPLRKVLVVDDNHDAADSTGMLLCMLRADARVVHDGASALELLEAWKPQLLLLDLACPAWTA